MFYGASGASCSLTGAAAVLRQQGDAHSVVEVGGIALVSVDVDLQLAGLVGADQQVFEHRRAGAVNLQLHPVAVADLPFRPANFKR